jgi:hypothetical protein
MKESKEEKRARLLAKAAQEIDEYLEWEDPFLLSCDGFALKAEREKSSLETQKRLAYIVSILQILVLK